MGNRSKWIKFISVEKNIIENENETHIKIFFSFVSSIVADSCTITKNNAY
jgi:hypothetical protein